MKTEINLTTTLISFFKELPKDQLGKVGCYFGTIGLVGYALKLHYDYKMASLDVA